MRARGLFIWWKITLIYTGDVSPKSKLLQIVKTVIPEDLSPKSKLFMFPINGENVQSNGADNNEYDYNYKRIIDTDQHTVKL